MKDNIVVEENSKWVFDEAVTDCFEDMLKRSIPQYDIMRKSISGLINSSITRDNKHTINVLDIGCSDGLMIEELMKNLDSEDRDIYYTGVDISEPMLNKAKYRFLDDILNHRVSIENCDLRENFPIGVYDYIVSCLSIQFTPIECRQHIIQNIYNSLNSTNGTFIMVEKVLGSTDRINKMLVDNYYDMKRDNDYTEEQIQRKRQSLEGVLVPVTSNWNIELLKQAGFKQVDVFWRWMNFEGYIAIK